MNYTRQKIVEKLKKDYGKKITGARIHQILKETGIKDVDYEIVHSRLFLISKSGYKKILLRLKLQNKKQ